MVEPEGTPEIEYNEVYTNIPARLVDTWKVSQKVFSITKNSVRGW